MRCLTVLVFLLLSTSAQAATWTANAPLLAPGGESTPMNKVVFGGGIGSMIRSNGSLSGYLWAQGSADGGTTWAMPTAMSSVLDVSAADVAATPSGSRVWAIVLGSSIQVARGGPTLQPPFALGSVPTIAAGGSASSVRLAVNPAGDALVVWTIGVTGSVRAALWPAGAATPDAPQTIAAAHEANTTAYGVLDPDRAAAVAFGDANSIFQATKSAASSTFGSATAIGPGSGVRAAQAPDGRAALAYTEEYALSGPNAHGVDTFARRIRASTRPAGGTFTTPGGTFTTPGAPLLDNPDRSVTGTFGVVVAGDGRALVAFSETINARGDDPNWDTCEEILGQIHVHRAIGVDASSLAAGVAQLSAAGRNGTVPRVAAGPGGQFGMSWQEQTGCNVPGGSSPPHLIQAAFAPAGGALAQVDSPPKYPETLAFREDSRLFALMFSAQSGLGRSFSTSSYGDAQSPGPGPDPGTQPPTTGGGSPPPAAPPAPPAPVVTPSTAAKAPTTPAPRIGSVKNAKDGSVTVSLTAAPGTYTFEGLVKRARAFRVTKRVTKRGTLAVRLKLAGKHARTLRQKRKLVVSLKTTFTPASGPPATSTRSVTFRR